MKNTSSRPGFSKFFSRRVNACHLDRSAAEWRDSCIPNRRGLSGLARRALSIAGTLLLAPVVSFAQHPVTVWLTTADGANQLKQQSAPLAWHNADKPTPDAITVDDSKAFQTIDGFGHALTGGSAQLLMRMSPAARTALIRELFGSGPNDIHTSYIRVSVGASDMNDHVFTYDDMPAGETDPTLARFSLAEDEKDVIPVLREILKVQPGIKILASPWTAPAWMKDNGAVKAGHLKPEFYDAYARYWVLYLKGMAAHGIPIDALTPQNEPENPKNTPSMVVTAEEEAAFIGKSLGPALAAAGLKTKIISFDHNCDHPIYSENLLADPAAARYTDGSGFHLYAGPITALSAVHDAFPTKNIYFTEQMVVPRRPRRNFGGTNGPGNAANTAAGSTPPPAPPPAPQPITPATPEMIFQPVAQSVARLTIGAPENWSRNVLLWNLAADPQNGPHTDNGGCPVCTGALTLDGDKVTRLTAYFVAAHASKFVPAGSVRISSAPPADPSYSVERSYRPALPGGPPPAPPAEPSGTLPHVAFRTPSKGHVLIVSNPSTTDQPVHIRFGSKQADTTLAAGAVATYVW